jgi:Ring finger domain
MFSSIASWRERQQTRQTAERVDTEEILDHDDVDDVGDHPLAAATTTSSDDDVDEVNSITEDDDGAEEGEFVGGGATSSSRGMSNTARTGSGGSHRRASSSTTRTRSVIDATEEEDSDGGLEDDEEVGGGGRRVRLSESSRRRSTTGRRTLRRADLEEERELVRRRTSACVLLSSFILLRLWIQAVVSGDFGLLLLCLVFTSWTARFIRHTREREETLDRMINEWDDNAEDEVNDARLRRMSFQSQLALAIMQSQMQMMQGGHGHPDGGNNTPGVSDEAKGRWDRFTYQSSSGFLKAKVKPEDADKDSSESSDDEPHCSICLGEYEDGEKLVMLPCKHIYHDDCISSWCQNHTRCPLCNIDLENATGDDAV